VNPIVAALPGSSFGLWGCRLETDERLSLTCLCCGAALVVTPKPGATLRPTMDHGRGCPMPALAGARTPGRQRRALRRCLAAAAARRAPQPEAVQ